MNPQYFDIIIFGAIAVFFIFKLIKSLGVRPDGKEDGFGEQDNRKEITNEEDEAKQNPKQSLGKVLMMPLADNLRNGEEKEQSAEENKENEENSELKGVFYKIFSIDNTFHPDTFLAGAKNAFTMIIEAFGKDDEDTLKTLVDNRVFATFKKVLDGYKEKGQKLEQTLIGINNVKIEDAALDGNTAKLVVLFETEQAKVIKDADGKIVEEESVMMSNVKELWTFSKDLKSSSPNWTLISVKGYKEKTDS